LEKILAICGKDRFDANGMHFGDEAIGRPVTCQAAEDSADACNTGEYGAELPQLSSVGPASIPILLARRRLFHASASP
jgi:hypothetical protein